MIGKFILRKDKKSNEYGEYCVYLQYSTMGVSVKKSMDIWVKPDHWLGDDGRTNKFIQTGREGHPKGDLLNKRLVNIKREYDKVIDDLLKDPNTVISVPVLRSILNGSYNEKQEIQKGKVPFIDYVLKVNGDLYKMGKISYSVWSNIHCSMNRFKKYLQQEKHLEINDNNTLYCKELTVDIIKGYIEWRKSDGNTNETINKSLTPIFKTVKKIMRQDWIDSCIGEEILDLYLPTNSQPLGDEVENDKHYLTEDQIKQLIRITEQSKYPRTKELVDMFLFSIHTGGMRFSDICCLRWSEVDMENRTIKHLQVKNHTKKPTILTLPITDEGMKILEKWKGKNENFVFDMLCENFDLNDEKLLKHTINSLNKTMNQSLRCLGEKMKLSFNLHFHCSRHTFGTLLLNKGVDLNVISHLMGHSSPQTTMKVYSKYLPETLNEIVNEKLNFNFN